MARGARWAIPNGLYHVMNRGIERREIVRDDQDRREWMRLLNRVAHRGEWRVFAHVLMDNHFHLFLRTPLPNLSDGMHDLQSGYATLFNQHHKRTGHLFQGRFKSILVESEGHAWELSRYVHLNPVRAGRTSDPAAYHWSSYRHFLNPRGAPSWLDWRTVFAEVSQREAAARIAYKRFVEAGMTQPPADPFRAVVDGWLLGSELFVKQMRKFAEDAEPDELLTEVAAGRIVSAADIVDAVAKAFDVSAATIHRRGPQERTIRNARAAAVWLLRETLHQPVTSIATMLGGVGKSAISETFRRAEQQRSTDDSFRRRLDELRVQVVQSSILPSFDDRQSTGFTARLNFEPLDP